MLEFLNHNLLFVVCGLLVLAIIAHFIVGLFYFRNAVRRHDFDMAMVVLLVLYALVLVYIPQDYFLWNYLGIGWGVLLFVFVFKVYFGEIIMKGTVGQRVFVVLGILAIILVLIFGAYVKLPGWVEWIPAF